MGGPQKMDLLRLGESPAVQEAKELEALLWREADERLRSSQTLGWTWAPSDAERAQDQHKKGSWGGIRTRADHSPVTITGQIEQP